jgi:colanic acid/amylovoran biosynthesis glycosyltransferase
VVTVSQFNRTYLQQVLGETPGDVRCLYNGIDLRHFRPKSRVERDPRLILAVGRLVEKKGFDVLVDACAILQRRGHDFRCEIIGKGDRHNALAQQISAHGLDNRVTLVGPRPQDAVRSAYQKAALFALPCRIGSDGNRDGLPTVLLEAMACGLPVVTTPVTGNLEIVDDGLNGRLVPENDPAALANALAELLPDETQRRQMGIAARQKVKQCFNVRCNVAQLHQWLAEPAPPVAQSEPTLAHPDLNGSAVPAIPAAPRLEEVLN